jgi:hypothetical protein
MVNYVYRDKQIFAKSACSWRSDSVKRNLCASLGPFSCVTRDIFITSVVTQLSCRVFICLFVTTLSITHGAKYRWG